ncbi:ATP synthase F1 subunit epsilon [Pendulispora albinea]|uniref:ATP synthase epsilon chain n=1 Tax=Pendulispora albinea TaxID=2741071 RepID=A0ABZ2LM82_9BACT
MADNKIELEIVTPRGRALAATVDEVTAPSVNGELGVLPGHLPLLAALQSGVVSYKVSGEQKKCAVGPGFAEIGPEKLLILTDEFTERDAIDPVLLRKEFAEIDVELTKLISESTTDAPAAAKRRELAARENWIAAQLELYGDPPPPTMRTEEFGPPPPPAAEDVPQGSSETNGG